MLCEVFVFVDMMFGLCCVDEVVVVYWDVDVIVYFGCVCCLLMS